MGLLEDMAARLERIEAILKPPVKCGPLAGEFVVHTDSPLGPRTHCRAVRRRMAEGDTANAKRVGKKHYLTREALLQEMDGRSRSEPAAPEGGDDDPYSRAIRKARAHQRKQQ